ncbi:hypothetical protein GCM10027043_41270 [Ferruginibacter profundus]
MRNASLYTSFKMPVDAGILPAIFDWLQAERNTATAIKKYCRYFNVIVKFYVQCDYVILKK